MNPEDLRIFTYDDYPTSSWGFSMSRGVHVIHLPTGLEVRVIAHRSPHKNKAEALAKLAIKVEEYNNVSQS